MKYKIFRFNSRNTGWYFWQGDSLKRARDFKTFFDHIRIDGPNGFFEEYENGEMTSWSMVGHDLPAIMTA